MEEPVPGSSHYFEHGVALYDPLCSLLHGTFCIPAKHHRSAYSGLVSSQTLFAITPLNWIEWKAVLYLSAPVLVIDEILKFISVSSGVVLCLSVGADAFPGNVC